MSIRDQIIVETGCEDLLFITDDEMDEAIIGVCTIDGVTRVNYDAGMIIEILMQRDGMDYEEAVEFFGFNIEGAYMGEHTPVYTHTPDCLLGLEPEMADPAIVDVNPLDGPSIQRKKPRM